jgi:hypothetical protein
MGLTVVRVSLLECPRRIQLRNIQLIPGEFGIDPRAWVAIPVPRASKLIPRFEYLGVQSQLPQAIERSYARESGPNDESVATSDGAVCVVHCIMSKKGGQKVTGCRLIQWCCREESNFPDLSITRRSFVDLGCTSNGTTQHDVLITRPSWILSSALLQYLCSWRPDSHYRACEPGN